MIPFFCGPEIPYPEQETFPSILSEFCLSLFPKNNNNYHIFGKKVNVTIKVKLL